MAKVLLYKVVVFDFRKFKLRLAEVAWLLTRFFILSIPTLLQYNEHFYFGCRDNVDDIFNFFGVSWA